MVDYKKTGNKEITSSNDIRENILDLRKSAVILAKIASSKEATLFGNNSKIISEVPEKNEYNGLVNFISGSKEEIKRILLEIQDFLLKI